MSAVKIDKVRKSYGSFVALSDISLDIPTGSFFTLLGPSGCGKTTLLRTLAGFHAQDSGRILVDGVAIEHVPAHKRGMGMVFQDYAVFPHLSVADNIGFGLRQRKVAKAEIATRVAEALKIVQLGHLAARMPHELSGGQQQRVGLARALVINPRVLLMDEPLSNLDAKLRVDLRQELRAIQQKMGFTTVYVTHDQEEALAMSDIICVMYGGVIQQASPPFELYNNPVNKFVATFVGENNFLALKTDGGLSPGAVSLGGVPLAGLIETPSVRAGTDIVAAVRPEDVSVVKPGTVPQHNGEALIKLPAMVESLSFLGRDLRIIGQLPTGERVDSVTHPTAEMVALRPGDAVSFTFPARQLKLFENTVTGRRLA